MIEEGLAALRVVNIGLGFTCFVWTLLKMNTWWEEYPTALRGIVMALLFFSFAATYGSAEQVLQHVENGIRPIFTTVGCTSLLIALWRLRGTSLAQYQR